MSETILGDAITEFKAERLIDENGKPYIKQGFSRKPLDMTGIDYLSPSRIKKLVESPRHYWWRYVQGHKDKETPAKKFGKILHWALLEPEEFRRRYVLQPEFSGTGMKAAKAKWLNALPPDAIVLTDTQAEQITHMIDSIQGHPHASKLLTKGTPEVHTYAYDPQFTDEHGKPILWYFIIDFYRSGNWITEVKSTACALWRYFQRDCFDYGYHLQTYINRRGVHAIVGAQPNLALLAVENTPPWCTEVFRPVDQWYDQANYEVTLALEDYRAGRATGVWPSYSKTPSDLSLAAFSKSRFEEEMK